MSLTPGSVRRLIQAEGQSSDPSFSPTLQVIKVMKVGNAQTERFRTIISDGQNYVQGMLATQLNHLVNTSQIKDNTIIQVNDFMNNLVQGRNVIILLGVNIINVDPGQKFGDPLDIEKDKGFAAGGGAAAPQTAQPMYGNNSSNNAGPGQQQAQPAYVKPEGGNRYGGGGGGGGGSNNPYNSPNQNRFNPQSGGGSAPIVRNNTTPSGNNIMPISQLNLYMNRWAIRARVTTKSDIRHWSNAKGEGCLFSIEMLDSSGMDIRATFFKEAVDKFYNLIEVDKIYTFSGGRLKVANVQYNNCKSQCEITFDQNAEIHLDDDTGDIQHQLYDFVRIADLENVEPGKQVDVVAVVKSVGQVGTIVSKKSGKELTKCELVITDDSGAEVNLTVWGDRANKAQAEFANCPVVAFRRSRVSDFGGRSLSAGDSVAVNPKIPEMDRLRSWWQTTGSSGASRSLSSSGGGGGRVPTFEERKPISAIKNEHLGQNNADKPDWICFKGRFNFLKKDKEGGAWYTACANSDEPCKNRYKVTQTADGNWHCEKCQQTSPTCVRRYIFSGTVTDDSSTTWVSIFNEQAEKMFDGAVADDVYRRCFEENINEDEYNSLFARANFTEWLFTCKVKQEMVGDEARVKTSVYSLHPVDYAAESRKLLGAIAAL